MDGMIDPRPVPPAPKPSQGIPWQQAVISDKPGWLARSSSMREHIQSSGLLITRSSNRA